MNMINNTEAKDRARQSIIDNGTEIMNCANMINRYAVEEDVDKIDGLVKLLEYLLSDLKTCSSNLRYRINLIEG